MLTTETFNAITVAVAKSKAKVTDFSFYEREGTGLVSLHRTPDMFSTSLHDLAPSHIKNNTRLFGSLTRLFLAVDLHADFFYPVSPLLSAAVALEDLSIDCRTRFAGAWWPEWRKDNMWYCFAPTDTHGNLVNIGPQTPVIRIPCLKNLSFTALITRGTTLIDILSRHQDTIENLTLCNVHYVPSTPHIISSEWDNVLDAIRDLWPKSTCFQKVAGFDRVVPQDSELSSDDSEEDVDLEEFSRRGIDSSYVRRDQAILEPQITAYITGQTDVHPLSSLKLYQQAFARDEEFS